MFLVNEIINWFSGQSTGFYNGIATQSLRIMMIFRLFKL